MRRSAYHRGAIVRLMLPLHNTLSRRLLLGSIAGLFVATAVPARPAAPAERQPVTPMTEAVKAELAPNGRLRAALNYSNFLLVSTRTPEHTGVAPDLARELARRANATVEFVGYDNAGLVADAAANRAWDVAFIGAEPARAGEITFTPAYVEIEAGYLVPGNSKLWSVDDVDHEDVRIVTAARAAYTLYLQRTLRRATIVEADGAQGAADRFGRENFDVMAGLMPRLLEDVQRMPATRIIPGRFTAVQQSMGVRKERAAAAAYLAAFADEIKTSGLLASLIQKHGARGLTIAK